MRTRRRRKKHIQIQRINLPKLLKIIGIVSVAVYVGITVLSLQVKIAANVRAARDFEQRTALVKQEALRREEELLRIDDDDYLEEKAREAGYVKPNERVIIDANKVK